MALRNIVSPKTQQNLASGAVNSGGLIWLFEPGTTTFVSSFTDSSLIVANTNPIRISGSGRANAWITRDVDMYITDRNGVLSGGATAPTNIVSEELNANPDSLGNNESGGLVANGSFEIDSDANGTPDSWALASEAGATNAIDTSESTDGGQSFRFTSTGNGGGSLTTTDFFPVNDTDNLRVNVDLRSTVAGVRNIVRVEWYDVSQVSISNSDPYDSTANPATYTNQALVIVPPSGARFARLRLIGADPSVALAGSTYFDRVQVFYPAVVAGVFDNITISGNDITSTNTNGDINVTPNGTGSTRISGMVSRGTLNNDPATSGAQDAVVGFQNSGGDSSAEIGFTGGQTLNIRNFVHGGPVSLTSEDLTGTERILLLSDPDGAGSLYQAGNIALQTRASFGSNTRAPGGTDVRHYLQNSSATDVSWFRNDGAQTEIRHLSPLGGNVNAISLDLGGVARVLWDFDPDGRGNFYDAGTLVAGTLPAASGGFQANNTLTGAGFERALTTSDLLSNAEVKTAYEANADTNEFSDAEQSKLEEIQVVALKTAQTARNNTITRTADPDLQIALSAGIWRVDFYIRIAGSDGIGYQWSTSGGTAAIVDHVGLSTENTSSQLSPTDFNFGTLALFINTTSALIRPFVGSVIVDVTSATTITFNWAQAASSANPTTVNANSHLMANRLGDS